MTADINKIFLDSSIIVEDFNMSPLCFVDGILISKEKYSLSDGTLNMFINATDNVNFLYNYNQSNIYEYSTPLSEPGVILSGDDVNGKTLSNLNVEKVIVFVNGKLLRKDEYEILDNNHVSILISYNNTSAQNIIIYVANSMNTNNLSYGVLDSQNLLKLDSYKINSTLIFVNGKKIPSSDIIIMNDGNIRLNKLIQPTDFVEYYDLGGNTTSYNFKTDPGYMTFGPLDDYNKRLPFLYDTIVTFDNIARLVVDNIRPGFIFKETDGYGEMIVVDDNFETTKIKCISTQYFRKPSYAKDEYFLEVPEARSIIYYLSEYDKKFKFLPEILGIFQKTILNEVYDSIQRIRDMRSLTKVDSDNINRLIYLLGFDANIKQLSLKQRHELLEELNEWYRIVGTKNSYNMFNIIQDDIKLINIEQLFTPSGKRNKNKIIYEYEYSLVDGGENYKVNNRLQIASTDIVITVTSVDPNTKAILEYSYNDYDGYAPLGGTFDLISANIGANFEITSDPINYKNVYTITDSIGYSVGQTLSTQDDRFVLRIDEVDKKGTITKYTPEYKISNESVNITDEPLLLKTTDPLLLNVASTALSNSTSNPVKIYSKTTPGDFSITIPNGIKITKIVYAGANSANAYNEDGSVFGEVGKGNVKEFVNNNSINTGTLISGVIGASPTKSKNEVYIGGKGFNDGTNGTKNTGITGLITSSGGAGSTGFLIDNINPQEASGGGGAGPNSGKGGGKFGGPANTSNVGVNGQNATENSNYNNTLDGNGYIEIWGYAIEEFYNNTKVGELEKIVLEPGTYYFELSGAGGSGGSADNNKGSHNNELASNGYPGQKRVGQFTLTKVTEFELIIGQGGRPSKAKSSDRKPYPGAPGIGYKSGIMGSGYDWTNGHYVGVATPGSGGGSSMFRAKDTNILAAIIAAGGNGGMAGNYKHKTGGKVERREEPGGLGGSGGNTLDNGGARGGDRAIDKDWGDFYSKAGQNGWLKIYRVAQKYTWDISGDQSQAAVNDVYKTVDNKFTVTVTSIVDGKIKDIILDPQVGNVLINNTYRLENRNANVSAKLSVTSDVYSYNYIVELSGEINNLETNDSWSYSYDDGKTIDFLVDKSSGNIIVNPTFNWDTKNQSEYILVSKTPIALDVGSGGKISIVSTTNDQKNSDREYVDFYTKQELGAIYHKEYRIPFTDYGYTNEGTEGSPYPWLRGDSDKDYGLVTESTHNSPDISTQGHPDVDYGYVTDPIKGKYIDWWEWNRDRTYYPTNHVEVEVRLQSNENQEEFVNRFVEQFYNLASAVLYIHRLVQAYYFGNNQPPLTDENDINGNTPIFFGIMTGQPVTYETYTLTSDPARQVSTDINNPEYIYPEE